MSRFKIGDWLSGLGVETIHSCSEASGGCVKRRYDGGAPTGPSTDVPGDGTTEPGDAGKADAIAPEGDAGPVDRRRRYHHHRAPRLRRPAHRPAPERRSGRGRLHRRRGLLRRRRADQEEEGSRGRLQHGPRRARRPRARCSSRSARCSARPSSAAAASDASEARRASSVRDRHELHVELDGPLPLLRFDRPCPTAGDPAPRPTRDACPAGSATPRRATMSSVPTNMSSTVTDAFGGPPTMRIDTVFGAAGGPHAATASASDEREPSASGRSHSHSMVAGGFDEMS